MRLLALTKWSCLLISLELVWFSKQTNVTITLDVGTENCIPLLAELFISDSKSKLVDIEPITSKKGIDMAKGCFQACHMKGNISSEELRAKVVVTGDGAFAKGNALFKNELTV